MGKMKLYIVGLVVKVEGSRAVREACGCQHNDAAARNAEPQHASGWRTGAEQGRGGGRAAVHTI